MIQSRVYARLAYDNPNKAAEWLTSVFEFREVDRSESSKSVSVWLEVSGGVVMISKAGGGLVSPKKAGKITHAMTIHVADVDAHYAGAVAGGAKVERDLATVDGQRSYEAFDLEGHRWHFTQKL